MPGRQLTAPGASNPAVMQCPRCHVEMETVQVTKLTIDLCPQCEGSFYDHHELSRMFAVPDKQMKASHLLKEAHAMDREQPVHCPRCQQTMERGPYFTGSEVLVDRCPDHGIWLDGGELNALLGHMNASVAQQLREQPGGFLDSLKRLFRR